MDVNLVAFDKNGSRKVFPLPSTVTVIGRRHSCDLRIPLMSVSKRHCQLNIDDGVLKIRDLNSRNGTYLNGNRINEAVIRQGDYIEVGPLAFAFQIDGRPETVNTPKLRSVKPLPKAAPVKPAAKLPETLKGLDDIEHQDDTVDELEELDDIGELVDDLGEMDDNLDDLNDIDPEA
jgi:pSer/pThr/pTyr-binding forkhead associated (FHA) protein